MIDWLGKLLYGKYDRSVRRKHLRSLGLALVLGLIFCGLVAGLLYYLYKMRVL